LSFALKYRPKNLDDIIGQEHLLSKQGVLRKLIESHKLPHSFFYGPAGVGKTSLVRVISKVLAKPFYEMNATTLKSEDLRKIFKDYHNALEKPLIFIDEIHRLSKTQQEVLLPFMENNSALIMGASTQNPYYSLTSALRSRSHTFELYPISYEDLALYLEKILKKEDITIEEEAKNYLILSSGGDVRAMLNLLESSFAIEKNISLATVKAIRPQALLAGSYENESHYELSSAMIKSIRGSDIDASLYYLARLIKGGEPAEFIARRLAILAAEDIGNANPPALNLASSTLNIVKDIGYPEARIVLSQLVIYLASSPKSNSAYLAINKALKEIEEGEILDIPTHIKSHNPNYLYPHDFQGWVKQSYLTKAKKFYFSKQIAFEKTLLSWQEKIKKSL